MPRTDKIINRLKQNNVTRALIILIIAGIVILGISLHGKSDDDTAHDLYAIQSAIMSYYHNSGSLPPDLKGLKLPQLKHSVSSYRYTYMQDEADNFTLHTELCADFTTGSLSTDSSNSSDNNVSVYQAHHKGTQCFINNIYKNQEHIALEK